MVTCVLSSSADESSRYFFPEKCVRSFVRRVSCGAAAQKFFGESDLKVGGLNPYGIHIQYPLGIQPAFHSYYFIHSGYYITSYTAESLPFRVHLALLAEAQAPTLLFLSRRSPLYFI